MSRAELRHALPDSVMVGGLHMTVADFTSPFARSQYVRMFDTRSRWSDFKSPDISDAVWQSVVGMDANNWKHESILSVRLWHDFVVLIEHPPKIWGERPVSNEIMLDSEKHVRGQVNAVGHDNAEATKGDHANPGKSNISEILENIELIRMTNELCEGRLSTFGEFFRTTFEDAKRQFIDVEQPDFEGFLNQYRTAYEQMDGDAEEFGFMFRTYDMFMFQTDLPTAKFFNIFEKSGYLRTGLHCWKAQKERRNPAIDDDMADRLQALGRGVLLNGFSKLIDAAEIYPPVFLQLIANAKTIREIFAADEHEVAAQLFTYQQYKTQDEYAALFSQNREKWREFEKIYMSEIEQYDPLDP